MVLLQSKLELIEYQSLSYTQEELDFLNSSKNGGTVSEPLADTPPRDVSQQVDIRSLPAGSSQLLLEAQLILELLIFLFLILKRMFLFCQISQRSRWS